MWALIGRWGWLGRWALGVGATERTTTLPGVRDGDRIVKESVQQGMGDGAEGLEPLRVAGEITDWHGHAPEAVKAMKDELERLKDLGVEPMDD